jgi:hypothetical protein
MSFYVQIAVENQHRMIKVRMPPTLGAGGLLRVVVVLYFY